MNITTKVTETHYATCDICDNAGPESGDKVDAMVAALEEGWKVTDKWNDLELVSTTLCPRCARTSYEARYWAGLEKTEEPKQPPGEEATGGPQ